MGPALFVVALAGCGNLLGIDDLHGPGTLGDGGTDACVGLECQVVDCAALGMPPTSVSGTVYAPNGTLPLYGVNVYVPRDAVPAFTPGATCDRCSKDLPGSPIAKTTSDAAGAFKLDGIPAGDNVPLIITIGRWRRQIVVPHVARCSDTALAATDTSLPRDHSEGDIPQIALTTGAADSLECLIRKLGVADSEITIPSKGGRVHFYLGNGVTKFAAGWAGGSADVFPGAQTLWNTLSALTPYDMVIFSCEGAQNPNTKSQAAMDTLKSYADLGGRVFLSHWHNIWIEGATDGTATQRPAVWPSIAVWSNGSDLADPATDSIDEVNNPKGMAFATWMVNVMGSPARDQVPIQTGTGRQTCMTVDRTRAEPWVYNVAAGNATQNFEFTAPTEAAQDQRCGKVMFSDMHVSGGPGTGDYPTSCTGGTQLTPQEKAIAFMFFDIASCVGTGP